MFTVLSFLLFIQVLTNGNLDAEGVVLMLVFGWEMFLFVGIVLDSVIFASILLVIALIIGIIIYLILQSKKKKKVENEEIDRIMDEQEIERLRRENHG